MSPIRSARRAVATALGGMILAAVLPTAQGQLPQPRLTSLARAGMRAGETVEVTLRGTDLEGASRLWFDHPGIRGTHVKGLTFRVIAGPDVPLGQHDVRALGTYGLTNPRTIVVGDRPESMEAEPNNTPEKANPITINTVVNGEINGATDVDCFAIEGKRGQRLFLDVQAERIDSRLDATLRLLSPAGHELAESRDVFGSDPFLDVTLPDDGRYVIKLHDAVYAGSPNHIYRLKVHDGPHLDAILPMAAPAGLNSSGSFTMIGRGLGRDATPDPQLKEEGRTLERLRIAIPLGDEAGLLADSSRFSRLFVPAAAATREGFEPSFVRINWAGAAPVVSNRLFLARAAAPILLEQEPNDDDAHAQTVLPPFDLSGMFDRPGDVDRFRFPGRKGEVWWIEAFAERIGSPADPAFVIQKLGAPGQPAQDLASGDDLPDVGLAARFNTQTVDAALRWQVPEDGRYQVLLSDLYGSQRGQPRLTYRLVIRREQPDFSLIVLPENPKDVDAVTVRAGGRAAAVVAAIRKDGFAGAIRVEARDRPPGLHVPPVTIGPGQIVAPLVFEASEPAQSTVETITLVGSSRFADRKHDLSYLAGAVPLGPAQAHEAKAGGMTWPPYPNPMVTTPVIAPARLFRGFAVGVLGEPSPLALRAEPPSAVVPRGGRLTLNLTVTRRAGFDEAVVATATDLPPNMPAATVTIAKKAQTAALTLSVPRNVPPGIYTFLVRGTGAYPFSKDPKAKTKPNVSLTEPSNPITITVH
ncbi:MAG TPA: pre-peptidase [Isosphaeraceae bacterium]|nr:pre-peptidase [Isosphaeraceae bacterium]